MNNLLYMHRGDFFACACFEAKAISSVRLKQTEMYSFNTFCPGLSMK